MPNKYEIENKIKTMEKEMKEVEHTINEKQNSYEYMKNIQDHAFVIGQLDILNWLYEQKENSKMSNQYENEWNKKIEKLEKYIKENFQNGCNTKMCSYCKIAITTDHSLCNVLMEKK